MQTEYEPRFPPMDSPEEDLREEDDRPVAPLNFHDRSNIKWAVLEDMGYEFD